VQYLEEFVPGEYVCVVEGTEDYMVHISVHNGTVTDFDCYCPYDAGPVCKHVVAVMYLLRVVDCRHRLRDC
jgi:uncharacterized Zn finger protein